MKHLAAIALFAAAPAAAQTGEPEGGTIIAYRTGGVMGFAIACPIRIEGETVAELGRGRYVELTVPAGRTILTNKTSSVELSVDPGETRYVRCNIKSGFMTARADLQIVDRASYEEQREKLQLSPHTFAD